MKYWFLTYQWTSKKTGETLTENCVLDIHPLEWLMDETQPKPGEGYPRIIFFQEIDRELYEKRISW